MSSTSSASVILSPQLQFIVEEIVKEYRYQAHWITINNVVAHAIGVFQSSLSKVSASSGQHINIAVTALHEMINGRMNGDDDNDDHMNVIDKNTLNKLNDIISTVIPQVLAALSQVEEGCIVLCEDLTELVQESRWFCCRKKTPTTITTGTLASKIEAMHGIKSKKLITKPNGTTIVVPATPVSPNSMFKIQQLQRAISDSISWNPKTLESGQAAHIPPPPA